MSDKITANAENSQNIFLEMRKKAARRAEQVTEKEVQYAAKFKSDKTSADEAKMWVMILLAIVTGVVVFLAFQYYMDVFSNTIGEMAFILALGLGLAVEIGKIKLLLKCCHAVVFGWWQRSWYDLGLWLIVAIIAIGCFWWSVHVSTKGMKEYAEVQAETLINRDTLASLLSLSTASIDSLIAAETASRKVAEGSTWRGQQTVYGLRNAKENNRNIGELQKQRSEIVAQVTADYKDGLKFRAQRTSALTNFITRCGGYMELASFLCVLALAFFDRRLIEVMRDNSPSPTPGRKATAPEQTGQTEYQNNLRANLGGAVAQNTAVAQCGTAVAQPNTENTGSNADSVLKAAKNELSRDMANLKNRNGQVPTVAGRMHGVFNRVGRAAMGSGFDPTHKCALEYYNVADEALHVLRMSGHPYPYSKEHLEQISVNINAAAA